VQLLLEHESNLNARSRYGSSPVQVASLLGHPEVVQLLLSHGADRHGLP
jgi:ankyrin repeat protein